MYVEGPDQARVESWVGEVRRLRYKDFQLVTRPGLLAHEGTAPSVEIDTGLSEVESVKEFGSCMERRGGMDVVEEGDGVCMTRDWYTCMVWASERF